MRHHWAFSLLITAGIIMLASALLIFASGGLSQLELFDEKPLLNKRRGEEPPDSVRAGKAPAYEAYAVRFATARDCPLAYLVKGADPKRKIDLAMTFWVLKDPGGRTVLVDAGFYRQEVLKTFGVANFTRPDKALERLGIKSDEVTDVILTQYAFTV
jgi:hypothetical protein